MARRALLAFWKSWPPWGLVLPALTEILPWLTPLAAVGLGLTMMGGAIVNLPRRESQHVIASVVLFVLALVVAYGQFVPVEGLITWVGGIDCD